MFLVLIATIITLYYIAGSALLDLEGNIIIWRSEASRPIAMDPLHITCSEKGTFWMVKKEEYSRH